MDGLSVFFSLKEEEGTKRSLENQIPIQIFPNNKKPKWLL
jgi:hypothetical protein